MASALYSRGIVEKYISVKAFIFDHVTIMIAYHESILNFYNLIKQATLPITNYTGSVHNGSGCEQHKLLNLSVQTFTYNRPRSKIM